jgi:Rhodopirellula transposase DDE domain/Helix-turn-helix of DDE superfamily endonuclease
MAAAVLAITVCHLPPGTSKWNKIEHRLFCHITMNWRGRPLTSHEVILQSIAATTTGTGLSVHAQLDTGDYPTGVQVSDADMAALPIARHPLHGDWNYTMHPHTIPTHTTTATDENVHAPAPDTLSHPTLTGMTLENLTTLTTALDSLRNAHQEAIHAAYRQALETADHNGIRPHAPRSGRPPTFTFGDRVLATVLHLRLGLPDNTLAHLFTTSRATIGRVVNETRQLLDEHGTHIPAAPTPPNAQVNLLTAATQRNTHP